MVADDECDGARLAAVLDDLLGRPDELASMARAARPAGHPDAADRASAELVDGLCPLRPAGSTLDLTGPASRVHVVGVGGAGMSAIATVLAAMGHRVSGSDLKASPVTDRLAAQGVAVSVGHRAEQVAGADVVTFSPAVRPDNPELVEAGPTGGDGRPPGGDPGGHRRDPAVPGGRRDARQDDHRRRCSSLVLVEAGLRPSFLIGADVNEIGTNAVLGRRRVAGARGRRELRQLRRACARRSPC